MVRVFLSEIYTHIFYVQHEGTVTAEDDECYWEDYLKPFMNTHRNIVFIIEFLPGSMIIDPQVFETSDMDVFDPNRQLRKMIYIGLVGIQRSFMRTYIKAFPLKAVEHIIYDHFSEFENDYSIHLETDFRCVFQHGN